jgi:outer membrane biogenesis lipoprotein LolB
MSNKNAKLLLILSLLLAVFLVACGGSSEAVEKLRMKRRKLWKQQLTQLKKSLPR